jgi:glycosyltransferase involved in cell wall biosynthesis
MRITYVLLSATFGMHQYTADPANRMVLAGHDVSLVTSSRLPRDRYSPAVAITTPMNNVRTGLSPESLNLRRLKQVEKAILATEPDVVHFSGPHLWNPALVQRVREAGVRVVHTIHDLEPHKGTRLGMLLPLWNRSIVSRANKILVHGQIYRRQLIDSGAAAHDVVYTPLLHLFLGYERTAALNGAPSVDISYEPFALFFGRLAKYKGVEHLLTAFAQIKHKRPGECKLVLAGPGKIEDVWAGNLPPGVEVRQGLIDDEEALDLFRRCSLVLLPYTDATQSALVGAAYYFRKPVLVSRSGALAEYVQEGQTGFVVEPEHPASLARALTKALCGAQALRAMGEAGRKWYEKSRVMEEKTLAALYGS